MRYAMGIEYDGTEYHGWQRQRGIDTIQAEIERAVGQVANHTIEAVCAGRTDRGVHAFEQVAHFDTQAQRSDIAWLRGVNRYLPPAISVKWIKPVPETFHARFSALARRYVYFLYCHPARPSLLRNQTLWQYQVLDLEAMRQATTYLLGEQDFCSFRGKDCQAKTTIRTMHHVNIKEAAPFVMIDVKANAFLHHMVRNIVGALLAVGYKQQPPQWIETIIAGRTRCYGGMTVPASGLHFWQVDYLSEFAIPHKNNAIEGYLLCRP